MIDSIVKVINGIVRLRGGTDDTLIGNTSNSLNVGYIARSATTTFTAASQTVELDCAGLNTVGITLTGTFTGFQASIQLKSTNGNYITVFAGRREGGGVTGTITTQNIPYVLNVSGAARMRVICTAISTGSAVLDLEGSSTGPGFLQVHSAAASQFLATVSQSGGVTGTPFGVADQTWAQYQNSTNNAVFAASTNGTLVGTSETALFLFRNPNASGKTCRIFDISYTGAGTFRLYALPTITSNGTTVNPVRLNIVSGSQGNVGLVTVSPTISVNGSIFDVVNVSTQVGSYNEPIPGDIILPANTNILVTAQMAANNTATSVHCKWMEV
jgi:hypothetical protein